MNFSRPGQPTPRFLEVITEDLKVSLTQIDSVGEAGSDRDSRSLVVDSLGCHANDIQRRDEAAVGTGEISGYETPT